MYLEKCTEEQLQLIYNEFDYSAKKHERDVEELKKWLKEQPHLPNVQDDTLLRSFVLRCKTDLARTKKTLELYYTTKAKMLEVFTNRDVYSSDFKKCMNLSSFVPVPKLTPDGHRVGIFCVNAQLEEKMPSSLEYIKAMQLMGVMSLKLDVCKKSIIVCDFSSISLPFITLLLMSLRRMLNLSTKVIPFRYHKIYILNAIPAVGPLIALTKRIANKEVGQRIEIWKKSPRELIEVIPRESLPSDYGGTEKSLGELKALWIEEMKQHSDWLALEERDIADLKPKKSTCNNKKNEADISFQNLNLD